MGSNTQRRALEGIQAMSDQGNYLGPPSGPPLGGQWYPAPPKPKKHTLRNILLIVVAIFVLLIIIGIAFGGSSSSSSTGAASSASASTAANQYVSAYNTMNNAVNADVAKQNTDGSNPTALTAVIDDQIAARHTFDTAVAAITFPAADGADVKSLIAADVALENDLGTLAANTTDTANYNSVFATVTSAQGAFAAAATTLENDLGLTSTG